MAAKSQSGIKSREIIGVDQFSQRREVFDKHDTVFLPPASPTSTAPVVDPIITSNHGKTTTNFIRNSPAHSSMRETRNLTPLVEFRARKYSDNLTSELNQTDDTDYRRTMTDRTRRLSKLRRDFLTSNLHEPCTSTPFTRSAARASLPARSASINYKIESPNLYKFPFAEPYTPTPVRKIINFNSVDETDKNDKENQDPDLAAKRQSLPASENKLLNHHQLFEELVKRYSPQRKPLDLSLPPTKPKVVGTLPKSANTMDAKNNGTKLNSVEKPSSQTLINAETKANIANQRDSGSVSLSEIAEKHDKVPEMLPIAPSPRDKKRSVDKTDLTIPALIEKMNSEGNNLESHKNGKKVKRKRSFLDKLLGRNKNKSEIK